MKRVETGPKFLTTVEPLKTSYSKQRQIIIYTSPNFIQHESALPEGHIWKNKAKKQYSQDPTK